MCISPHHLKFTIYFVGSDGQLSRVFDPRPLSYLEHWLLDFIETSHKKNFRVFSWAGYFISQSRRRRQFKSTTYLIMLNLNNKLKQEKEQSRPNINLEPESLCMSILLSLRACQVHKVKTRHLDASHASFAFLKQAHKQLLYARRHMFLKLHVTYT